MTVTEDQKAMKELLEAYAIEHGMSLVSLLARYRRVDEPLPDLIERVYKKVEEAEGRR